VLSAAVASWRMIGALLGPVVSTAAGAGLVHPCQAWVAGGHLLGRRGLGRDAGLPGLMRFFSVIGGMGRLGLPWLIVGPVIAALCLAVLGLYGKAFRMQIALSHQHITPEVEIEHGKW